MNKQELIDKAVEDLKGKFPSPLKQNNILYFSNGGTYFGGDEISVHKMICTKEEFTQRARDLGWCNGYKYGVKYETNGKKPDLPKDVKFKVTGKMIGGNRYQNDFIVDECDWRDAITFCITDKRYKPVEPKENKLSRIFTAKDFHGLPVGPTPEKSWHEKGELPPVGEKLQRVSVFSSDREKEWFKEEDSHYLVVAHHVNGKQFFVEVIAKNKPTGSHTLLSVTSNEFRPLKSERERFVEAALKVSFGGLTKEMYGALYDAGFKAPEVVE